MAIRNNFLKDTKNTVLKTTVVTVVFVMLSISVFGNCITFAEENDNADSIPGELIAVFKSDTSVSKAEKITGYDAETIAGAGDSVILDIKNDNPEEAIETIESKQNVEFVQPNYLYTYNSDANSSSKLTSSKYWSLDYMDVPEAWKLIEKKIPASKRTESRKIRIASIDSGIDTTHPDLDKNVDIKNCVKVSVSSNGTRYIKSRKATYAHGTSLSLLIGATASNKSGTKGVASGPHDDLVQIMGINVFYKNPVYNQSAATTSSILSGIEYARNPKHKADVMYMCLGHTRNSLDGFGHKKDDIALKHAVNKAVKDDIVVVCSAGNNGNTKSWYPSDFKNCISVINTPKYSNVYSKCKYRSSNYGKSKNVSAPGHGSVISDYNGKLITTGGTSASAGNTAGVIALIRYANRNLSVKQVKRILYSTTTDLYKKGYDLYTGYGNVNAYSAVSKAFGKHRKIMPSKLSAPRAVIKSTSTSVTLAWSKSKRANFYKIYRKTGNSSFRLIKRTASRKWTDSKLQRGRKYAYRIVAYGTSKDGKPTHSNASKTVRKSR